MPDSMEQAPRRAAAAGPALIRLLGRLADLDAADSGRLPSDQLAGWLAWTDAISLAAALDGQAPPASGSPADPTGDPAGECARVRGALAEAIAADLMLGEAARRARAGGPVRDDAGAAEPVYEPYRERYLFLQRRMETRIGSLRARLRTALAARGGEMARLAAVDAVMEQVLGARERSLLGSIPALLERRFERLRQAAGQAQAAWLDAFRKDARGVLLAELDLRFQPVGGLAEAIAGR